MKHIIKYSTVFIILTLFLLSCQKDDLDDLHKVIYVRYRGADMPAYIYGNGSEKVFVIILHGGPGGSGLEYRMGVIKDDLEKKYAVVYFDQRNSGMSQGNYSDSKISIDLMAEDVVALIKVLQHKFGNDCKFFLMGHSWGGSLGTAVLLNGNNQNLFKGWIEVDGGHDLHELFFETIRYFKRISDEQIALGNSVSFCEGRSCMVNSMDTLHFDSDNSDYLNSNGFEAESKLEEDGIINSISDRSATQSLVNTIFRNNPLTVYWNGFNVNNILSDQEIWEKVSYTGQLYNIKIPSLFLWGRYDMVIPPAMGQDAYNNIGSDDKKLVIFEKSGHSPMDNEGQLFFNEVVDFIERNK